MPTFKISKIESARRQLNVAVTLYFKNGDAIAVHTLVAAARNVLINLCGHRNIISPIMFNNMLQDYIRPECRKEVIELFREPENFFKHADRDPEGTLDFNPEFTEFLFIEAIEAYASLTGEVPQLFSIFRMWWLIQKPDMLKNPEEKYMKALSELKFGKEQRVEFYQEAVSALAKLG